MVLNCFLNKHYDHMFDHECMHISSPNGLKLIIKLFKGKNIDFDLDWSIMK